MNIAIGADHAGFPLKRALLAEALDGHDIHDVGVHSRRRADYPRYAFRVARMVSRGEADLGVLICGTGIGMAMAASRVRGIRPAVCTDEYMARMARAHNHANVLCLGGRVVGPGLAASIVRAFLVTPFEGGRHADRVAMLERGDER
ncbi:MAG: ribose 5-phosphate isomerase B [Candidatus Bipolaricaulaceae bacterium]